MAFTLGDIRVEAGSTKKGYLGHVAMADGSQVGVPVVIVNGKQDGPVAVITAGVHGTEVSGIHALHKVLDNVDADELNGVLVAVTLSSPLAVTGGTYASWVDAVNMASALAGPSPKGSSTERMASFIWQALDLADYHIDLHANPMPALDFTLTDREACADDETLAKLNKLVKAFGLTVIDMPNEPGEVARVLGARGVPSIIAELNGNIQYWDEIAEAGRRGVMNVLKAFGQLPGRLEEQNVKMVSGDDLRYVGRLNAGTGGFMRIVHGPGEKMEAGDTAIEIYDVFGDLVEEVVMPVTGYCWSYSTGRGANYSSAVCEGMPLAYIFAEAADLDA